MLPPPELENAVSEEEFGALLGTDVSLDNLENKSKRQFNRIFF